MRRAICALATAVAALGACADGAPADDPASASAGMFRDFLDGKADGAGHPLNARIMEAEAMCADAGTIDDGAVALAEACRGALDGAAQRGELAVSARLRVAALGDGDAVVTIRIVDGDGAISAEDVLTAERVRELGAWIDASLSYGSDGAPRTIEIAPGPGVELEVDYVEVFPRRFGLVLAPGSGVVGDADTLTIEVPLGEDLDRVELDGVDVSLADLELLRTDTAFRTLYAVTVGELAPLRGAVAQLRVRAAGEVARVELRRAAAPCAYEGDPDGLPVLVTGFQPFPADGWHDNVAQVAVEAVRPARLRGARVLRLILPVEYDRAAAAVRDAIARCAPAAVISFGQGGGAIALEETAYNLQDTGEVPGGVPDNRGVIAAALPIDRDAPAERASSLPLDRIAAALETLGEDPSLSDDPGRYICNNVFFVAAGAIGSGRAGFVHLPYTTHFDAAARARWRAVAETTIQAVVDAR